MTVEPHPRFAGVFLFRRGRDPDRIATLNLAPGNTVYGERLFTIRGAAGAADAGEYRIWSPTHSKIGASLLSIHHFGIAPGSSVLYLGAASGTTVSHVSDVVGPSGRIYAVEFSLRVGRGLVEVAKTRPNIVPIIEDARRPQKYRVLVPIVDCLFADVSQPDQDRIFAINAEFFLRNGGFFMLSVKAKSVDSTIPQEEVFGAVRDALGTQGFRVEEQVDLEAYHAGHAALIGTYRPA
jgi:rRNA 2'-O-methyltransferase fibrillarin